MKIIDILRYLDEKRIGYELIKETEENINGYSSLFNYKDETMTFIVPERRFEDYAHIFKERDIRFIITGKQEKLYECFSSAIQVEDPRAVFFDIIDNLFENSTNQEITGITNDPKIYHKNSYISSKAKIGENVRIGVGCVIEGNVIIGDNTEIHHNVVIRNKTRIGRNCMIHSGVIIGEYGFGYVINQDSSKSMLKHYGGVVIEDNVHIGDNSVIIRGAIDDTIIKKGVKMNTMVHIAHNDLIGENTIITSPCHICGSVIIGDRCHIAGSTVRNQRTIGNDATIGLGAVVVKDIDDNTIVIGNPARDKNEKV